MPAMASRRLLTLRAALLVGAAGAARRALVEADLDYDLREWNRTYRTRAHALFSSDAHFRSRLFEHESALGETELASFHVRTAPGIHACDALRASLEARAGVVIDATIGDDLLTHATRTHAAALRDLPEVQRVVPALPELKMSPDFARLLPNATTTTLHVQTLPLKRHEHLRGSPADVAAKATRLLREACAEDAPALRRACAASPPLAVVAHSERYASRPRAPTAEAWAIGAVLSRVPEVVWLEPAPSYAARNREGAQIVQSGSSPLGGGVGSSIIGATPVWDLGIHGEGEVIGIGDTGLDMSHCFFEESQGDEHDASAAGVDHRKVVHYRAYADDQAEGPGPGGTRDHGTHVAGSCCGKPSVQSADGADEIGVAYESRISFTDIGPGGAFLDVPADLYENYYIVDYDYGARVHTNSWGAQVNAYTVSSAQTDAFMHAHPEMLVLFAAGNSGLRCPLGPNDDRNPPCIGSIGSPATAKNIMAVGAAESTGSADGLVDGNLAPFSSIGPTADGRHGISVVAPGSLVTSAASNVPGDCPTYATQGTSMAAPMAAGSAALVRQYWREGWYPYGEKGRGDETVLTGAAVKAVLINSAVAMRGTYQGAPLPDTYDGNIYTGYGRIQLDRVLFGSDDVSGRAVGDRILLVDGANGPLTAGGVHEYPITTAGTDPALGNQLKVTLVWTDPPGQPQAQQPLVNDLDLEVVTPDGAVLRGNGVVDRVNTQEQVALEVPTSVSTCTVRVVGASVKEGPQAYALVVTGPLNNGSPPPAPRPPSPPSLEGDAQGMSFGDTVVLAVCAPLLAITVAIVIGVCVWQRRRRAADDKLATQELPEGWERRVDPKYGATYYVNPATGASSWEHPGGAAPAVVPLESEPLPEGWASGFDAKRNATYYVHAETGKRQWERPEVEKPKLTTHASL